MARLFDLPARLVLAGLALAALGCMAACQSGEEPMSKDSSYPSPATLGVLFDGAASEFFAVTAAGKGRDLTTTQFFEVQADELEINRLKRAGWDVAVPPGVALFAASGGRRRDALKNYWAGWRTKTALHAVSLMQEEPIEVAREAADALVDPPLVMPSRRLHQYVWRRTDQAWQLLRHEFEGELNRPGSVKTVSLLSVKLEPSPAVAAAVPGAEADLAVVAWVERSGDACVAKAAWIEGETAAVAATGPLAGSTPLPSHRPALTVDPAGHARFDFLVRTAKGACALVEVDLSFAETPVASAASATILADGKGIHSAAVLLYPDFEESRGKVVLLGKDGTLSLTSLDGSDARVVRTGVDLAYPFPLVASYVGLYEARAAADGDVSLAVFP